MSNFVSFDTEEYYDKDDCTVRKLGNWAYAHHPKCDNYWVSVADENDCWAGPPSELNWSALEGKEIVAHNQGFDFNIARAQVEKGLYPKFMLDAKWHCTANLSAYLCNRRSMDTAVPFLLGKQVDKGMRNWMQGKTWEDALVNGKKDAMVQYGRMDARHCYDLWANFNHLWPAQEQELSQMTYDYCDLGVRIDTELLDNYILCMQGVLISVEAGLPWMLRGKKPTSPKAIAEECRENGIPSPPIKAHEGEEAFIIWENCYKNKFPWVAGVSNWRQLNKFLGQLETIKARLRPDGTVNFGIKYFGAHTGRDSADSGLNMLNLRKEPIFLDHKLLPITDEIELKYITRIFLETGLYPDFVYNAVDIRKVFIPREGKKFILPDLSQIEPRVLAWLCGDFPMLEKVRQGFGIYEANAISWKVYDGAKGGFKKNFPDLYQMVKAQTLALGYGCGWKKYIQAAYAMASYDVCALDDEHPESGEKVYGSKSQKEVTAFREGAKDTICKLWQTLESGLRASVGGDYTITLPSGRKMNYRQVRRELRTVTDDEGKTKKKSVYTADIGGKRTREVFYGGFLTENITQATARDVLMEHRREAHKQGYCPLWNVYDSLTCEVDKSVQVEELVQLMSKTPEWLEGCPIAAEAEESMWYKK